MAKGTVLVKFKGKIIPKELIEHVIKANKSCFGYALIDDKDGLDTSNASGQPDINDVMEAQEVAKDNLAVFGFCDYPESFISEDEQPWEVLRDSKNNLLAVAFAEGDFKSVMTTDSSHVDAYHLINDHLNPKIKLLGKACKYDLTTLNDLVKEEDFRKEIKELFTGEGSIALVFSNGSVHTLQQPDGRMKVFDWGWATDLCGWSAQPKEEPKKQETLSIKDRIKAKLGNKSEVKEEPKTEPKEEPAPAEDSKPKSYHEILKKMPSHFPPKDRVSNQDLKAWYRSFAGYVPENWKERPATWSREQQAQAKLEFAKVTGLSNSVDGKDKLSKLKDTAAHNLPEKEDEKTDILAAISNGSLRHISEFRDKFLDKNSQAIPDPKELKEADRATALQRLGLIDWDQLRGLPSEGWKMLIHRHDLALLAVVDLFNDRCKLRDLLPSERVKDYLPQSTIKEQIAAKLKNKAA